MKSHSPKKRNEENPVTVPEVDAYVELVVENRVLLKKHIHRMTGNRHDTEDLCQETALRVLQHRDTLDSEETATGWLLAIGRRVFLTFYRKRKVQEGTIASFCEILNLSADIHGNQASPNRDPSAKCERDDVYGILPEDCREIYRDSIESNYTARELADRHKLHINTIYKRLAKAEDILDRKFGDQDAQGQE